MRLLLSTRHSHPGSNVSVGAGTVRLRRKKLKKLLRFDGLPLTNGFCGGDDAIYFCLAANRRSFTVCHSVRVDARCLRCLRFYHLPSFAYFLPENEGHGARTPRTAAWAACAYRCRPSANRFVLLFGACVSSLSAWR